MEEVLSFTGIIEGYRGAAEGSEEAARFERAFDENTREWAALMIDIHIREYGIHPENRAQLWEISKRANLDILLTIEIEISFLENFMDFYVAYIHQSLIESYFHGHPRLAEIIRKNVKHKYLLENVIPQLERGELKNIAGRKVQERSVNPPVRDAWAEVKDGNYPRTLDRLCAMALEAEDEGAKEYFGLSSEADMDIRWDKLDLAIRKMIWEEVESELENMIAEGWNYDRKPFSKPGEETKNYFRTTVNWFLMNHLFQSEESSPKVKRIIGDLEKKERYNRAIGAVDNEVIEALFRSFETHGPNEFYKEEHVGVKGKNLGVMFDKIANGIYNRILFPELAKFTAGDWGIERQ